MDGPTCSTPEQDNFCSDTLDANMVQYAATGSDPDAGQPNQSVAPNAGDADQCVDPNAGQPNQSVDPNAGDADQCVDPNAGQPNQSVDPNAGDADQCVDPNAGQPNQSIQSTSGGASTSTSPAAAGPASPADPAPPTPAATASPPDSNTPPPATASPAGKSTTLPLNAPPSTPHADAEAESLYEVDLDVVRTSATKGGNVPPDPQFQLKITQHVEVWSKQSAGAKPTWSFTIVGDPNVALQSGKNFKPVDVFAVNIAKLVWDSHVLPATELSLQANGSIFLDQQIGAQLELEQPLSSNVSIILDGTFDYGKGPDSGLTNWSVAGGLEFKLGSWGRK